MLGKKMKGPFYVVFLCLEPWHLQRAIPKPGGEWRMTVKVTLRFLSHIHVDMAKPHTQKNMCKNHNPSGLATDHV